MNAKKSVTTAEKKGGGKYILIVIVLLLTVLTFSDAAHNGFTSFDDNGYITGNTVIRDLSPRGIKTIFTTAVMGNYHPLVVLSDAIIYKLYDLNSTPYHVFNIILHLVNVLLVFIFISQFLKLRAEKKSPYAAAALATCIFAVHPLHVESVAWLSDLKDLLYTLFYLASMIFYIKYLNALSVKSINQRHSPQNSKDKRTLSSAGQHRVRLYIWCCVFFILSLFSKSAAVTLPVVLVLIDYLSGRKLNYRSITEKIPLFILSVVFGIVNIFTQKGAGALVSNLTYSYADRFFMLCYSLVYYLYSFVFPIHLTNLHPFPVKVNNAFPMIYYLSPAILLIVAGGFVWLIRKSVKERKTLIFGLLFFLVTIFLVLQFIPFGFAIVSERYTYLPYVGLLIIAARYYVILSEKKPGMMLNVNLLLIGVIITFSIISYERNKVWATSTSLLEDLTKKEPDFPMAYDDLGVAKLMSQDFQGAISEFDKALKLDPKYYDSYNNRGEAERNLNEQEKAWKDYNKAIELNPLYSDAYNNRGIIKYNRKDFVGAIVDCTISIMLKPDNPNAYNNRASSRIRLKEFNLAFKDYDKAIELNPYYADGYKNRGLARYYIKDYSGACKDWEKAAKLGNKQSLQFIQAFCK